MSLKASIVSLTMSDQHTDIADAAQDAGTAAEREYYAYSFFYFYFYPRAGGT